MSTGNYWKDTHPLKILAAAVLLAADDGEPDELRLAALEQAGYVARRVLDTWSSMPDQHVAREVLRAALERGAAHRQRAAEPTVTLPDAAAEAVRRFRGRVPLPVKAVGASVASAEDVQVLYVSGYYDKRGETAELVAALINLGCLSDSLIPDSLDDSEPCPRCGGVERNFGLEKGKTLEVSCLICRKVLRGGEDDE